LALSIRGLLPQATGSLNGTAEEQQNALVQNQTSSKIESLRSSKPSVDCIFVDQDQYFDSDKPVSKTDTSNWKSVLKSMKGITQRGESFVLSMADPSTSGAGDFVPIFAVADVSFWLIRDFGTCLMKRAKERSASGACQQVIEQYPKYKRTIRTLGVAIDNFMKRNGFWVGASHSHAQHVRKTQVTILLYSKADDRFDMVTLESGHSVGASHEHGRNSRRK
jgi:hypothetical protein